MSTEWEVIDPADAREGDRVRLHRGDEDDPWMVEGVLRRRPTVSGSSVLGIGSTWFGVLTPRGSVKVERARRPLPTEPGTVIDATIEAESWRLMYDGMTNLPWAGYCFDTGANGGFHSNAIESWSVVADAPKADQ